MSKVIKDKDKLFIVAYVGIKDMESYQCNDYLKEVSDAFDKMFDGTVKGIVVPKVDSKTIEIKTLNTEKVTIEKLNETIQKSEELIKSLSQKDK